MSALLTAWDNGDVVRLRRLVRKRIDDQDQTPLQTWAKTMRYQFPGRPYQDVLHMASKLEHEIKGPPLRASPAEKVGGNKRWTEQESEFIRGLVEENRKAKEPKPIRQVWKGCRDLFQERTDKAIELRFQQTLHQIEKEEAEKLKDETTDKPVLAPAPDRSLAEERLEIDEIYDAKVTRVIDYGIFIEMWVGRRLFTGLVHYNEIIRQEDLGNAREDLNVYFDIGDPVKISFMGKSDKGHKFSCLRAGFVATKKRNVASPVPGYKTTASPAAVSPYLIVRESGGGTMHAVEPPRPRIEVSKAPSETPAPVADVLRAFRKTFEQLEVSLSEQLNGGSEADKTIGKAIQHLESLEIKEALTVLRAYRKG